MLERIFTWFENRIDPLTLAKDTQPPSDLYAFYFYFLRQIWPIVSVACLISAISAFTDAIIPVFVGWIVDLFLGLLLFRLCACNCGEQRGGFSIGLWQDQPGRELLPRQQRRQ
jgi:hypothetical protein